MVYLRQGTLITTQSEKEDFRNHPARFAFACTVLDHIRFLIFLYLKGFTTLETREAAWVDPVTKTAHRIRTREGVCLAPSLIGASLS